MTTPEDKPETREDLIRALLIERFGPIPDRKVRRKAKKSAPDTRDVA